MCFTYPINTIIYLLESFLVLYNRINLRWNVYVKII